VTAPAQHPTAIDAHAAYSATLALLEIAAGALSIGLRKIDLSDYTLFQPIPAAEKAASGTYALDADTEIARWS
jgi:hypothetical protein